MISDIITLLGLTLLSATLNWGVVFLCAKATTARRKLECVAKHTLIAAPLIMCVQLSVILWNPDLFGNFRALKAFAAQTFFAAPSLGAFLAMFRWKSL